MPRQSVRLLATFVAGVAAATWVFGWAGAGPVSASRYEDLSLFTNVLNLVRKNYVEPVEDHELIQGAVKGMLAELDPHSSFLTPEIYKEMQIDTRGEFAGLGIEISKSQEGFIEVVAPIEGTPAHRAGIQARDQIVAICPTERPESWTEDCRSTKTMSLVEAVQLMRGPKGTEITIQVYREEFDAPEPFTIERAIVHVKSVEARLLEDGYGYLRLRAFQERTAEDLREALEELGEEAPSGLRGLVLDLRDNPGGLLDQAVEVADTWLRDGLIVSTKGRVDSQQQEFRARDGGFEGEYPLVVVVNGGTASASEIVAGALQDHHRALVLGTDTFGKGSVQTIIPLDDGSGLRLTTALYYTPSDRSIQEVGIAPDIIVRPRLASADGEGDAPRRLRERDLERHFTQEDALPGAGEEEPESADDAEEAEPGSDDEAADAEADEDLQLARALEVLKSWTYFERLREQRGEATEAASTRLDR